MAVVPGGLNWILECRLSFAGGDRRVWVCYALFEGASARDQGIKELTTAPTKVKSVPGEPTSTWW